MTLEPLPEIDASPDDPRVVAIERLARIGIPSTHVSLLVDVLEETVVEGCDARVVSVNQSAELLAMVMEGWAGTPDGRMMAALLWFARPEKDSICNGLTIREARLSERDEVLRLRRLLRRWIAAEPQIDLSVGVFDVKGADPGLVRCVLQQAAGSNRLDLPRHLDRAALRVETGGSSPYDRSHLWFWFNTLGRDALAHMLPLAERAAAEDVGAAAYSVIRTLTVHLERPGSTSEDHLPEPRTQHIVAWVEHIEARLAVRPDDLLLWATIWELMRSGLSMHLSDEAERRLLDATQRKLSEFRHGVATGSIAPSAPRSGFVERYQLAVWAVLSVGGCWKAMKALLLLQRVLPVASVGADLRYWREPTDLPEAEGGPPTHWRWVVESAAGATDRWAQAAREDDPDLVEMREELARFFLDRLRSRLKDRSAAPASDEDMIERSPHWRRGYIQAVRALRVNPSKSGHHVLHWLRANDPHEEIRKEAGIVHDEMARGVSLPPGTSPLRAVKIALWWTRYASRRALGLDVDLVAANRTKQKEMRRTTDLEETFEEK